jgi:CubicO group peptidase (beta-lactamase class C family)
VYERSGGTWRESATLLPDPEEGDFALDVAIDSETIVVGAPGDHGRGGAYVFARTTDSWRRVARLSGSGGVGADRFGGAVAISGDRLVVGTGAGGHRLDRLTKGAAYVFERSGSSWTEVARLTSCAPDVHRFGAIVAASGERVIVGSRYEYDDHSGTGDLSVFERDGGVWRERGRLVVSDADSRFWDILAVSASTALVGAPGARAAWSFDLAAAELVPPTPCPAAEPLSDVFPLAGWIVEPPEDHGMSRTRLDHARAYAFQPGKNTQGVVVVRHGVIVGEWYEPGRDETSWAASWSVAKSFTSALIGIAIGDGLIEDVDVSMARFIPEWSGTDKAAMTLRDVLAMSSGLDWIEDYSTNQTVLSDIARLASTESDQLAYVLTKPLRNPPGTVWSYSSADTLLLSRVIEVATGMTAAEYAQQALFGPLGLGPVEWWSDTPGRTLSYCCLDTPTREFAKFGLLYARGGRFGDRQVVPERFVIDSTTGTPTSRDEYGYQWWLTLRIYPPFPVDVFVARGFDGQFIYVMPSLDLVVVRNGHYDKDPGPPIADPNLFARYPSAGLGQGRGTVPPAGGWDDSEFIRPILESIFDYRGN